ncbi:MAG: sulfotransferase family 2 domain-containing protein [Phormidesmis sp.]
MFLRKPDNQYLYLFQHVPKCAGTTVINHVEDELRHKSLNLEKKYQYKNEVWGGLVRQNIKYDSLLSVHGHRVFYGLHNISEREYRYYTFLRHPVDRVISLYNFWASCENRKNIMFRDGNLISFREFIKTEYASNSILRFLYHAMEGELTPGSQIETCSEHHLNVAKKFLDKCWFVGFVESFEEDFQFVCSNMGINYQRNRKRASGKYFQISQDPAIKELVLEANKFDMRLFEYAKQLREG